MLQTGKIKIRDLKELQEVVIDLAEHDENAKTPLRKRKNPRPASSTTAKKLISNESDKKLDANILSKPNHLTVTTKKSKSALKEPPPSQKRIDSFFKSCQKTYVIKPLKEEAPTPIGKTKNTAKTKTTLKKQTTAKKATRSTEKRPKAGRKRLVFEPESTTGSETACSYSSDIENKKVIPTVAIDCITIPSDSEGEVEKEKIKELDLMPTSSNRLLRNLCRTNNIVSSRKSISDGEQEVEIDENVELDFIQTTSNPIPSTSLNRLSTTPTESNNKNSSLTKAIKNNRSTTSKTKPASSKVKETKQKCSSSAKTSSTHTSTRNRSSPRQKEILNVSETSSIKHTNNNHNSKALIKSGDKAISKSSKKSTTPLQVLTRNKCSPSQKEISIESPITPENSNFQQQKTPVRRSATSSGKESSKKVSLSSENTSGQKMLNGNATPLQSSTTTNSNTERKRKYKPCPPYKIIEGTSFAVDAFQFGCIENVTHYFLTHFHADHYIGLTRKFSMPLYMSPITARFVREFIPVDEQYIHEIELNETITINNIEITPLDANHCPGAIIIVFKFPDGKCILHTGDFRAWHGMESEPIFWNNDIHTIYLDTTYISDKYAFCTQYESIDKAKQLIEKFREKHQGKRILYICGSYVIGKEKFWSAVAEEYEMKVWAQGNRNKALKAADDERLNKLLIDDPYKANMHVICMGKIGYLHLVEYFSVYEQHFDIALAIRPSGWEKDSKPQYRGKINIIGVEYSEHSSYLEMQRFVKFLKPQKVLSTVPTNGRDLMVTAKIPQTWYKYDSLKSSSNYQPSIDTYFGQTPLKRKIRPPNMNKGGLENFVSPLSQAKKQQREINNNFKNNNEDEQQVISINSSEHNFEQDIEIKQEPIQTKEIDKKSITEENLKHKFKTPASKNNQTSSSTNVEYRKKDWNVFISNPPSLHNSSEDFELPEIIGTQTKANKVKQKTLNEKPKSDPKTKQDKTPASTNSYENCDTLIPLTSANSSEDFEKPKEQFTQNGIRKLKQKPLEEKTNIKTTQDNAAGSKKNSSKKKLIYEESSTNLYDLPETSSAAKLRYQKQKLKTKTTSEDDFEIPTSQRIKRVISRPTNKLTNSQTKATGKQKSITSSEEESIKVSNSQKRILTRPSNKISNSQTKKQVKQKSLTTSEEGTTIVAVSQKHRRKLTISNSQNQEQDKILEDTLVKLSKDNDLTITKLQNNKNPTSCEAKKSVLNRLTQNPLFKSTTTTSNGSTSADEIPASQTTKEFESTPRLLKNKKNSLTKSMHPPTPFKKSTEQQQFASTTVNSKEILNDLIENNKQIDYYNHSQLSTLVKEVLEKQPLDNTTDHIPIDLISDSDSLTDEKERNFKAKLLTLSKQNVTKHQRSEHLESQELKKFLITNGASTSKNHLNSSSIKDTQNPLFKSSTTSNCSTSTDEIPASQTTEQLESTPRLIRNKRNALSQSVHPPTPIKKAKDVKIKKHVQFSYTPVNSKNVINEILKNNMDLDSYNPSQLSTIVEETLGKQCLDDSTDHIPPELLSDPDADDDWMN